MWRRPLHVPRSVRAQPRVTDPEVLHLAHRQIPRSLQEDLRLSDHQRGRRRGDEDFPVRCVPRQCRRAHLLIQRSDPQFRPAGDHRYRRRL